MEAQPHPASGAALASGCGLEPGLASAAALEDPVSGPPVFFTSRGGGGDRASGHLVRPVLAARFPEAGPAAFVASEGGTSRTACWWTAGPEVV